MARGATATTLGDLFRPFDQLPAGVRLELATLAATPGQAPAMLPGQLTAVVLPTARPTIDAIVDLIASAEPARFVRAIDHLTMAEVVPAIALLEGGPVPDRCPSRVITLLERNGVRGWHDLGPLHVSSLRQWAGVGPSSLMALLRVALDSVADLLAPSSFLPDTETGGVPLDNPSPLDDLTFVLLHHTGAKVRSALEALASNPRSDDPDEVSVRRAAVRLLGRPARSSPVDPVLAGLDDLLARLARRERVVFEHLDLPLSPATSTTIVAQSLDVPYERIGQLRFHGRRRIREGFEELPDGSPLRTASSNLADTLGAVAPVSGIDDALTHLGLPPHSDTRSQLLLLLAGPYGPVKDIDGWLAVEPTALVQATHTALAEDGGLRHLDELVRELGMLSIDDAWAEPWIRAQPIRIEGDLVVSLVGSPKVVATRALEAAGSALTTAQLAEWTASSYSPRARPSASQRPRVGDGDKAWRLLSSDPRFRRVGFDHWELTEWGGDEYVDPDQAAALDDLHALADDDDNDDAIDHDSDGPEPDGRWHVPIAVTPEVLSGHPGPVPKGLCRALGIRPHEDRTFATRYGPVTLTHHQDQPVRGSVRPVALAAGCALGDILLLDFSASPQELTVTRTSFEPSQLSFPTA